MNFTQFVAMDTLVVLLLGATTFVFFLNFRRTVRTSDSNLPFVSVMVPVRNEERKIRRCLESLLNQDYPNYEVIVVDDRSTDRSGQIIAQVAGEHLSLKTLSCRESRAGWLGKCNALDYASRHAQGEWFAFIDADTCHQSNSLRDAVASANNYQVDLISFMPVQELYSFWERAIMPVLLGSFLLGDPLNKVNDDRNPRAYAYGQYTLIKADAYRAIGGHNSVRDQILDDIALARVVKSEGFRITAVDGRPLYSVRMYTDLIDLWRGWSKNLYALIDCNPVFLVGVLILLNLGLVAPYVSVVAFADMIARGAHLPDTTPITAMLVFQFVCISFWFWRTGLHYKGLQFWHILFVPVGALALTALYLYAAFCVITGIKVTWKDREYCVDTSMKIRPEARAMDQATK
ncbi:MAG: hypothetical protein C5B53_02510 [Candidatus Melainabacteria bacterium]|nr:MAG: hypothetical protein C5B53_02510 [Candidatus Melainabacteria bacterium]